MDQFKCSEQHLHSNYNYKPEIETELINSLPSRIVTLTQVGKVVRTAASILRLNLLECSLLAWLLRRSNYSLRDLSSSSNQIALFEQDQNKELLLLILLNAYYVKSFLNKEQMPEIDADVISMIPQFSKIYRSWRPDSLLKDASLSDINLTFNSWTLPPKRAKPDYNQYVNKILELSKTYNTATTEQEQPPRKKRKHNQPTPSQRSPIKQEEIEQEQIKMDKSHHSIWLRSSRIEDRNHFPQEIFGYEDINDPQPPIDLLRKSTKQRSFGYMNFDLDNSRVQHGLSSLFGQSIVKTGEKGLFGESVNHGSVIAPRIRKTSSFDEVNE